MPADVAIPAVVGPVRHGPLRSFFADFFKNRAALIGVVILSLLVLGAIFADFVTPYSPIEQYRDFIRVPPSWYPGGSTRFLLGTDEVGRDILTRLNGLIFLVADTFPRPPEPESASKRKKPKPAGRSEDLAVRLAQAGLRPIEIAGLTGRHQNNINRDLSKARKEGRLPRAK